MTSIGVGCPVSPSACTRPVASRPMNSPPTSSQNWACRCHQAFVLEFASWLTGPLAGAFDLVTRIPKRYRVGVLSNMSAFHWRRIAGMGLPDRFDFICVSCETGFLKPSVQAFQVALEKMALPTREVLFLDDGAANVDAARSLGMAAHVVKNPVQVELVLKQHGVL